jgi:pimeloyl-ACP methyl ester carboxylesterase
MLYALNLFNFVPGKEDQYRDYSVKAGKIIYALGGRVIAAGHAPRRHLHGDVERRQMIVVQFPSEAMFQQFSDEAERQGLHALREGATTDYIWTLFTPWDMRTWVKETGPEGEREKIPLVLLPGLLCDAALWAPQVEALSDLCRVFVADLTRDDTISAMAARVLAEAPTGRFALAGLSMGGYVAMEIMRRAPERVARLALLDTRARLDSQEETERRQELIRIAQQERGFTPVTNRMLPLLVHPDRIKDAPLAEVIRGMAERVGVEGYVRQQTAIMSRADSRSDLGRIACPTLILCGRQDLLTPLAMHEELAALIPGARLVVVEHCGHLSTLERPEEVNAALRAWLL